MEKMQTPELISKTLGTLEDNQIFFINTRKSDTEAIEIEQTTNAKELPKQNYYYTQKYCTPNTKVTNYIFNRLKKSPENNEASKIRVSRENVKKDAIVTIKINTDDVQEGKDLSNYLTPYDNIIFNAICSILESGQNVFTANQIYEAITNTKLENNQSHASQAEKIKRSIEKLYNTFISIDWSEHAKMNGLKSNNLILESENSRIVSLCKSFHNSNGKDIETYTIDKAPLLYEYAKAVNQVITIDKELLKVSLNNTDDVILVRDYLLRRIEMIKDKKNSIHNRCILFETIFNNCNLTHLHKTQTTRIRKKILTMLDIWKEKEYIKDYHIQPRGKTIYHSIKINI